MESLIRHQSQRLRGGWIPERNGVSGVTNVISVGNTHFLDLLWVLPEITFSNPGITVIS